MSHLVLRFFFFFNGSKSPHVFFPSMCFKACKTQIHIWRLSSLKKKKKKALCRLSHKQSGPKWGRLVELQKDKTGASVGPRSWAVGTHVGWFVVPWAHLWWLSGAHTADLWDPVIELEKGDPWFLGVLKPYGVPKKPKGCLVGPTTPLLFSSASPTITKTTNPKLY